MTDLRLLMVSAREAADPDDPLAQASDAFLRHGLVERLSAAGGQITAVSRPLLDPAQASADPIANLGHLNAAVADDVADALAHGERPLLAGGTCNHLVGMIAGLQRHYGPQARIGLLWLDAHGDFNTPATSRSGMLGGMPVAVTAGLCYGEWRRLAGQVTPLPTDRIVMVDVRNLDPEEEQLIRATDVEIARFGAEWDPAPVLAAVARLAREVDYLDLHVDADILDASLQPNHPTKEPGGPGVEAVLAVVRAAMATGKVRAFAVVSVNPTGDAGATSVASALDLLGGGVAAWDGGIDPV